MCAAARRWSVARSTLHAAVDRVLGKHSHKIAGRLATLTANEETRFAEWLIEEPADIILE